MIKDAFLSIIIVILSVTCSLTAIVAGNEAKKYRKNNCIVCENCGATNNIIFINQPNCKE